MPDPDKQRSDAEQARRRLPSEPEAGPQTPASAGKGPTMAGKGSGRAVGLSRIEVSKAVPLRLLDAIGWKEGRNRGTEASRDCSYTNSPSALTLV